MTDSAREASGSAPGDRQILLLVGAVGSGKGTQAAALSRELGLQSLASGNLFRQALRDGTPLGDQAREYMERGELVPDEITIAMLMDELAKPGAASGAILDGFPRTVGQARALDATLADQGERVRQVFYIDVPTDELVQRVAGRWICPTCGTTYHERTHPPRVAGICDKDGTPLVQRDDDRPEVVRARLAKQVPPMLDVVDHYDRGGILARLDGRQPIETLTQQMLQLLRPTIEAR